jgi:hypothetical protein
MAVPPAGEPALDYTRRVYANVLGWYENADRKAQLILTANGGFLTVLAGFGLSKAGDLAGTVNVFGPETWLFLGLAAASVVVSFASAVLALWSRLLTRSEAEEIFKLHGVRPADSETYDPSVLWFFQLVQHLDETALERRLRAVSVQDEIDALADEIVALARNVTRKHGWVNVGFTATAVALSCLVAGAVSYVIRLSH